MSRFLDRLFTIALACAGIFWAHSASATIPDNGKIAFVRTINTATEIWSVDNDGGTLTQLTNNTSLDMYPDVSPDGTRIAFSGYESGLDLYTMKLDGGSRTQVSNDATAHAEIYPRWSSDGTSIAYRDQYGFHLYKLPAAGGTHESIYGSTVTEFDWKQVGGTNVIAFTDSTGKIYTVNENSTPATTITTQSCGSYCRTSLRWSPTANEIIYVRNDANSGVSSIWRVSAVNGGTEEQLTNLGANDLKDFSPTYSPDGAYFAFSREVGTNDVRLFIQPLSGGGAVEIASGCHSTSGCMPDWGRYVSDVYQLSIDRASVPIGGAVIVSWSIPPDVGNTGDKIALRNASDHQVVDYQLTGGAMRGSVTFAAPCTQGDYEFQYLKNDGTAAGDAVQFTVVWGEYCSSWTLNQSISYNNQFTSVSQGGTYHLFQYTGDYDIILHVDEFQEGSGSPMTLDFEFTFDGPPTGSVYSIDPDISHGYTYRFTKNMTYGWHGIYFNVRTHTSGTGSGSLKGSPAIMAIVRKF